MNDSKRPENGQEENDNLDSKNNPKGYLKRLQNNRQPLQIDTPQAIPTHLKVEEPLLKLELSDVEFNSELEKAKELFKTEFESERNLKRLQASKPMKESLFDVPGVVSEFLTYAESGAFVNNRGANLAGAVSLVSLLAGKNFRLERQHTPMNTFIIGLAGSGKGKNRPQSAIKNLLKSFLFDRPAQDWEKKEATDGFIQTSLSGLLMAEAGSGQGLADELSLGLKKLSIIDEVQHVLKTYMTSKIQGKENTVFDMMLAIFSASDSGFNTRALAKTRSIWLDEPFLGLLAFCPPQNFFRYLDQNLKETGLLGRTLVLNCDCKRVSKHPVDPAPGRSLHNFCLFAANKEEAAASTAEGSRSVEFIKIKPEAYELLEKMRLTQDDRVNTLSGVNEMKVSQWNRYLEIVLKLAQVYAVSEAFDGYIFDEFPPNPPEITEKGVIWASDLWSHSYQFIEQSELQLESGEDNKELIQDHQFIFSRFHELLQEARKSGVKTFTVGRRDLNRKSFKRFKKTQFDALVEQLHEADFIFAGKVKKKFTLTLTPRGLAQMMNQGLQVN
jgi:hypothetical protein